MASTINWNYVGHAAVGTTITICQAVALADPTSGVLKWCGIIALVAAQVGASFGVWQAAQYMQLRRDMLAMHPPPPEPPPPSLKVAPPQPPPLPPPKAAA
jgi:hypothetical protein